VAAVPEGTEEGARPADGTHPPRHGISRASFVANTTSVSEGLGQRYAKALFDLADETKALDQVAGDLRTLRRLLAESPDLTRVVRSPLLGREAQGRAVDAVLERAGASDLVRRFVGVVAANNRLFALDRMAKAYLDELARRRGEMTAEVATAHPLTDRQTAALSDQLKKALGAKVDLSVKVDPSLLGGMVVRVGSRMIDSSIKTKLDRLQLAMKGIG
jgi:F-type H+-transporting ATPase subunit delta